MENTITLNLSTDIKLALNTVSRKEGISVSDLIIKAIREYLLSRQIRLLRERMKFEQALTKVSDIEPEEFDRLY
jgi:hypothetical protein